MAIARMALRNQRKQKDGFVNDWFWRMYLYPLFAG